MRYLQFLKNAAAHYFGTAPAQEPSPATAEPDEDDAPQQPKEKTPNIRLLNTEEDESPYPLSKAEQGRNRNPNTLERYDRTDGQLIAERFSPDELREFLKLYSHHVWTYRCASLIAGCVASVVFTIKKNNKEIQEQDRSGFLKKPNFFMTWFDLFEKTFLHLELAGNAYLEVQRDPRNGEIVALYMLRPDRVRIVPDSVKKIKRYEYWLPGNDIIKYEPQEILHLKYADALSDFFGVPPSAAANNDVILDLWATTWNKEFFVRGAEPGAVLETAASLTEMAWNRLMRIWNKRHRGKPHEVAILEEGLTYKPISSKHSDMQYLQGKEQNRDVVASAYGVPLSMLGVQAKSTGSVNDEKKVFWQHNITTKVNRLERFLNTFLAQDGITFDFNTKTLVTIIEDEKIKSDIAQSNVAYGIWTVNEARKIQWDMAPVEWGDTYWANLGLWDVTKPRPDASNEPNRSTNSGKQNDIPDPAQVPGKQKPNGRPPKDAVEKVEDGHSLEKMVIPDPDWGNEQDVRDYEEYVLWKAAAGPEETAMRKRMADFFKEQGDRFASRLEQRWPVKKDDETDDILTFLFTTQEEDGQLRAVLVPQAQRILRAQGTTQLASLGVNERFTLANERVQKFLSEYGATRVRQINETTRELLRRELDRSHQAGEPIKLVLARIRDVFEGNVSAFRAQRIARTEVVTLTNTARFEAAVASGVVVTKRWISERISTTRQRANGENHIHMHGQTRPLMEPFEAQSRSGLEKMMHPGDLQASAENVCNCICIAAYNAGTSEFQDILTTDPEQPPSPVPVPT